MDEGIPPEITGELRKTINAALLRVHSRHLAGRQYPGKLQDSLGEAYDVYADSLGSAGWALTDTLLNESIPQWVFQWAVVKQWVRYPPLRPVQRPIIANFLEGWYLKNPPPPFQPIPEAELTVQFGVYKVTESYKARFIKLLASPIAYWQAEMLAAAPAEVSDAGGGSLLALLKRILKERNITIEEWATEQRIGPNQNKIGRTMLFEVLRANGRAVPGRVSEAKAQEIANTIRKQAADLMISVF
jgi:hypothetical protein